MAVKAYVLITTANKETKNALGKLRATRIVQSSDAVTGPYDIIAVVEGEDMDTLGQLITEQIQSIDGIERTLSCIVLRL